MSNDKSQNADEESLLLPQNNAETTTSTTYSAEYAYIDLWPSTFERSISLLAGPNLNVENVDRITRSPRYVPPQVEEARRTLKKLNRGFLTPDQIRPVSGSRSPIHLLKKGLAKVKSLDFHSQRGPDQPSKLSVKQARHIEQQRKIDEAHSYREKVLKQAAAKQKVAKKDAEEQEEFDSPGYQREKDTDKQRKQMTDSVRPMDDQASTVSQCVFNLANILMGVGMLGLPYIFKSAGWVGGFFVTLLFAAITWRTTILIGRELNGDPRPGHLFDDSPYKSPLPPGSSPIARMRRPLNSFPDIAREAFGNKGAIFLASVLYFELFSCLAIFFVSLGDHMHSLFPYVSVEKNMIIVAVVLAVPAAILRTPRLLSYLSAVGTFATIAVVLSVALSAIVEGDISAEVDVERGGSGTGPFHNTWKTTGLPLALGLIAYTFSGHAIVPSIYTSMEQPQKFEQMATFTFSIVISCCLIVAISGYYMFGTSVQDQITLSLADALPNADLAMKALAWLMVLTSFSKFCLTMFPLALGLEEIAAPYVHTDAGTEIVSALIKLVLMVLALLVAIYVPSFSFLCSLVGLICTMIVSVIFPAAAHIKLFGDRISTTERIVDYLFIGGGILAAVVGTIATL